MNDDVEPDDEAAPPKPPLEIPDSVPPPTDQEENAAAEPEPLPGDEAAADDTIDDAESPEAPHEDLPEGARAADYDEEK